MRILILTISLLTFINAQIIYVENGESIQEAIYEVENDGTIIVEDGVHNGYLSTSTSQFKWDASKHSSGIYFVNIQSNDMITNQKVVLLK